MWPKWERNTCKVLVGKPERKRKPSRPRLEGGYGLDSFGSGLEEVTGLCATGIAALCFLKYRVCLSSGRAVSFSRRTVLCGVGWLVGLPVSQSVYLVHVAVFWIICGNECIIQVVFNVHYLILL